MKKIIIWTIIGIWSAGLLTACATPEQRQGAGVGGALGAIAGALIDRDNRWRGAVVGGTIGAALGGTVTEISARASREAAKSGKPVAYESADGWQRVEASPVSYNAVTKCHKVRERVWQDDKLVKDEVREVCESEKTENTY
jgi:hypothetical protein